MGASIAESIRKQTHREGIMSISQQKQYIYLLFSVKTITYVRSKNLVVEKVGQHNTKMDEGEKNGFLNSSTLIIIVALQVCWFFCLFFFFFTINEHKSTRLQYSATQTYCFQRCSDKMMAAFNSLSFFFVLHSLLEVKVTKHERRRHTRRRRLWFVTVSQKCV